MITPGSIDPAGRPNYIITGGTRPGDGPNLFHSFGDFSVGTNNVARFFNESGRATMNILSRVTGGSPSNIFGEISTQSFGSANFYLINPAGVIFGPNASLNLGGSGHFSTADYLRLGSGNDRFYADLGKTSQLTSAAVTAFGFLGERPAEPITVQAGNALTVSEGKALSLVGGDITITGRALSAPGGQINVASVKSAAEAFLNPVGQSPGLDVVAAGQTRTGLQPTTAEGTVWIRGGELVGTVTLGNNAVLKADSISGGKAGNIDIEAKTLNISPETLISAATSEITMDANSLIISASDQVSISGAGIVSGPTASGNTANVTITTPGVVSLTDGTTISTHSSTGDAGSVYVRSGHLVMENAGIDAIADIPIMPLDPLDALRSAGKVNIQSEVINLRGGALKDGVTIRTNNEGDITLAAGTLSMDNAKVVTDAQVPSQVFDLSVETGHIHIQGVGGDASSARQVSIMNGSELATFGNIIDVTRAKLRARDISVRATDIYLADSIISTEQGLIKLNGANQILSGGNNTISKTAHNIDLAGNVNAIELTSDDGTIALSPGDNIFSQITGTVDRASGSNAGVIVLTAPNLSMKGTSDQPIVINTTGAGATAGGTVTIHTSSAEIVYSHISTSASSGLANDLSAGRAGDILITGTKANPMAEEIKLTNSTLESAVLKSPAVPPASFGYSGTVSLEARHILLDNSTLSVDHLGAGESGSINVRAGELDLTNGTTLRSTASGKSGTDFPVSTTGWVGASGGDILIQANNMTLKNGSNLTASSTGDGNAGNILLSSGSNISLANSTVSTSATQASGGDIDLTAPNLVRLVGANLTSSVNGPQGSNGGNITIDTAHPQFVVMQGNSQVLAKANAGQGGAITIIGGVVLQEPGSRLDATAGPAGISGSVNIQAPFQQLSGAIAPLPQVFAVATNLYGQRCAAEKGGQFSSFVQGARDGVPPQPGDLIPSPLMLELDEVPLSSSLQSTASLSAIRLGLPGFEQSSRSSLTVFSGCRS